VGNSSAPLGSCGPICRMVRCRLRRTVFLGSDRDPQYGTAYIYAFDNRAGKLRWKHAVGGGTWSDALQDGPHIYIVTMSDEVMSVDDGPKKLEGVERGFQR
jgi:outer membrane protein assembly factor BamB